MIRTTLLALSLTGLVLVPLVASVPAESPTRVAPTEIDNCRVISQPGLYVLTEDITQGGGGGNFTFASQACLVVESDDVVLEGRGHEVDGLGVTDTTGITVGGANASVENVTIANVTVTDWNRGIYVRNSNGGTVRNATVANNAYGTSIEHASGTSVVRSHYEDNLIGVYEGATVDGTSLSAVSYEDNYAGDVVSDPDASGPESSTDDRATSATAATNASKSG